MPPAAVNFLKEDTICTLPRHCHYVHKLVTGRFSIWVALVPYHTVMTFQSSTTAIFPRSLAPRDPSSALSLSEFSLAASLGGGGQLHTSRGLPSTQ